MLLYNPRKANRGSPAPLPGVCKRTYRSDDRRFGGLLGEASPEDRIRAEVEEETGFRVTRVERLFEAFLFSFVGASVSTRPAAR
jgi:hypothetical protein